MHADSSLRRTDEKRLRLSLQLFMAKGGEQEKKGSVGTKRQSVTHKHNWRRKPDALLS